MDMYDNEFVPINHPVSVAGVKVNRNGEIILQNDDDEAAKTLRLRFIDLNHVKMGKRNNNMLIVSKENKMKHGPIVAFDIYRDNAWVKVIIG